MFRELHPFAVRITLGSLLAFGALNAFAGGYYGLTGAKGIPIEWLRGSPFKCYFMPSLFLVIVVEGSLWGAADAVFAHLRPARIFFFRRRLNPPRVDRRGVGHYRVRVLDATCNRHRRGPRTHSGLATPDGTCPLSPRYSHSDKTSGLMKLFSCGRRRAQCRPYCAIPTFASCGSGESPRYRD